MRNQAEFFDSRAETWEKNCYPPEVRKRLEALIPEFGVAPGTWVLDIGTGPGVLIPYLTECIGKSGQICAFDISFGMVREARRKLSGTQNMVLRADVHHMPFKDSTFDHIICFAAFPHFTDPGKAIQEMARVAKPGAEIVIAHLMSREELAKHHAAHSSVARDVLPDHAKMIALFSDARLSCPDIIDIPGKYLARGKKCTEY